MGAMNTGFVNATERLIGNGFSVSGSSRSFAGSAVRTRTSFSSRILEETKRQTDIAAKADQTDGAKRKAGAGTGKASAAARKKVKSAVEEYKKKKPEFANLVDQQVDTGKAVLRKNGVEDVDRDSMTMEEYKEFFTALMDSIPYNSSQLSDVHVWKITEKGWEQMKNDPDYEAWVLGYTSQDRAVYNPWSGLPGCSPHFHTERFGATINEHLGQSSPMNNSTANKSAEVNEDSWWYKRHLTIQNMLQAAKQQTGGRVYFKNMAE